MFAFDLTNIVNIFARKIHRFFSLRGSALFDQETGVRGKADECEAEQGGGGEGDADRVIGSLCTAPTLTLQTPPFEVDIQPSLRFTSFSCIAALLAQCKN